MSTKGDIERGRDPTGWVVICLSAIILAIIFAIIIYLIYRDINSPQVIQRCNPGLCKVNKSTGFRSCPAVGSTVGIVVTPGAEICTSRSYCNNPGFTCAVNQDQTLNCEGVCDVSGCKCIAN